MMLAVIGGVLLVLSYCLLRWLICENDTSKKCDHEWSGTGLKVSCSNCGAVVEIPEEWAIAERVAHDR